MITMEGLFTTALITLSYLQSTKIASFEHPQLSCMCFTRRFKTHRSSWSEEVRDGQSLSVSGGPRNFKTCERPGERGLSPGDIEVRSILA